MRSTLTTGRMDELDIEIEVKSLSSFLRSAKVCDTNVFDLLHAPRNMIVQWSPVWRKIRKHRKDLYAKNMKGMVGYIKTHAQKYSNKIDRLENLQKVLDVTTGMGFHATPYTVRDVAEKLKTDGTIDDLKYVDIVTLVQDHEQQYLEVCGKKYIFTWDMSQLSAAMHNEINRYGKRTNKGSEKGMDGKSLSHAIRVLFELRQIALENDLTFPLEDAEYIKKVKLSEVPVEEVMQRIDELYDECMELLEKSDLPEEPSIDNMLKVLIEYIEDHVI